jgi:WD40 repeat protein
VGEYQFWHVGSWQEEQRLAIAREQQIDLPGPLAFAPDGRLLALARSELEVQLFDPATSRQVARLPSPSPQIIVALRFSPEGSRLAVATEDSLVELWDLRRVREWLAERRLDWDGPPYRAPQWAERPEPLRVEVLPGGPAAPKR